MLTMASNDVLSANEWRERALRWEKESMKNLEESMRMKAEMDDLRSRFEVLLEASLQQISTRLDEYPSASGLDKPAQRRSPTNNNNPLLGVSISSNATSSISSSLSSSSDDHNGNINNDKNRTPNKANKKGFFKGISNFLDGKEPKRKDKKEKDGKGLFDDDARFAMPLAPSTSYQHLPRLQVCPLLNKRNQVTISGPSGPSVGPVIVPEGESTSAETQHNMSDGSSYHSDVVAGRTISTYPHIPGNPNRDGDPIADRFAAHVYENRVIACMADGCNWGAKPREAATKANTAFIEYVNANHDTITDVKKAGAVLLNAFEYAHNSIMEGKNAFWDAGTTTLLGGVLLEINKGTDKWTPQWEFVCASVGDCKAFCYANGEITDITQGNRLNASDPRDCGGRLGPHLDEGKPDLRNLNLFCASCEDGDLIIIVTDGVHDNLDPQHLGKVPKDMPKEFNLIGDKWDEVDPAKAVVAKNTYVTELLHSLLKSPDDEPPTPRQVTTRLVNHCIEVTKKSRDYMELNQGKRLPEDYIEFPGKMDHTSCLCFRVGRFPNLPEKGTSAAASQAQPPLPWQAVVPR